MEDSNRETEKGAGEVLDRCPKLHEVNEGSAEITAIGDKRRRYLCLDCGQRWEGGEIQLAMPRR